MLNRRGLRTLPWGTPLVQLNEEELRLPTTTFCILLRKKLWIHFSTVPLTPSFWSLINNLSWRTLSNAFDRSMKTIDVDILWSVRCDLQIFSGCVCHLEQLDAQSPFLFPIVFSINRSSPASIYIDKWEDRSTCFASRISTQKEPFLRSEFTLGSIWTNWMLIDRQMQSDFMAELHRWISKLTARHLHHHEIFWSPW